MAHSPRGGGEVKPGLQAAGDRKFSKSSLEQCFNVY
jgi:hypothetical protein